MHVGLREGWIWARRFFWCEPLFRSQCQAVGSRFQMEELPYIQGRGRIVIGDGVWLSGKPLIAFNHLTHDPELLIGDGTFVGHMCEFRIGRRISVGRHCLLAGGVSIASSSPSGSNTRTRSPETPSGSRLVAKIATPGHDRTIADANAAASPRTCSQLSRTMSSSVVASPLVNQSMVSSVAAFPSRGPNVR